MGRVVEKSWLLSRRVCDAEGRFEVMPDSHFGLGFVLSESACKVVAGGPITTRIQPHIGATQIYWLRFRPGLLPRIADVRPSDLVNAPGILLDRLRHVDIDELGEQLLKTSCVRTRLETLGHFFGSLGDTDLCQDHRCRRILEMVDRLDGGINVHGLAQEFGLSSRTIQRLLLEQVGLTPKQLILNVRLQRTLAKLKDRVRTSSQAQLASECGYVDQSHMIKDVKQRTGCLPSDF
jgi:AraC-like DNA-binding protein